ncbi:mannosyltransferase [Taxawa tesnikishii (nom. ined.)]|nr:mannosyltransferase [Dothideales sp. JES 119]
MVQSWLKLLWEFALAIAVLASTAFTITILTLPSSYTPYQQDLIEEDNFSEEDKKNAESGYAYFNKHRGTNKSLKLDVSVQVVVLGDIGRSPRMQYHATSIAAHGGRVHLVGYVDSEILPEIRANRLIDIVPIKPIPEKLRTSSKAMFPLIAPLKVLFQTWSLYHALGYRTKPTKWMLVQNPPSIPTLLVAQVICYFRNTRLIIDWHNFGYTILALKLGDSHPLVKLSEWYERLVAGFAGAHFTVTNAMARVLKQKYGIEALPLHDRPAKQFQPLSVAQRSDFLHRCPETAHHADKIMKKHWRLVVSSTSWTADEDFSILLDALVAYSATVAWDTKKYPKILAIITGKGPLKHYYMNQIEKLNKRKKLSNAIVKTAWLSPEDYATLLGAADLGVSLHTSSSGVDLPMKVVDMFGTGLPVVGYEKFEAWPELVKENVNGRGFIKADKLESLLEELFGHHGRQLDRLRQGAMKECDRRWDDEWYPVAGRVFQFKSDDKELRAAPDVSAKQAISDGVISARPPSPSATSTRSSSNESASPDLGPKVKLRGDLGPNDPRRPSVSLPRRPSIPPSPSRPAVEDPALASAPQRSSTPPRPRSAAEEREFTSPATPEPAIPAKLPGDLGPRDPRRPSISYGRGSPKAPSVPPSPAGAERAGGVGVGVSHATGESKLPLFLQKAVPTKIEEALPNSIHDTSRHVDDGESNNRWTTDESDALTPGLPRSSVEYVPRASLDKPLPVPGEDKPLPPPSIDKSLPVTPTETPAAVEDGPPVLPPIPTSGNAGGTFLNYDHLRA